MSADIIIRKQKFSIRTSSQQLAFEVRKDIHELLQTEILQCYQEVFDSMVTEEGISIYINKLELNLGQCSRHELVHQLSKLLKEQLAKQLREYPLPISASASDQSSPTQTSKDVDGLVKPVSTDEVTALFYFLENGIFPWWFQNETTAEHIISSLTDTAMERLVLKIIGTHRGMNTFTTARIRQRFLQCLTINSMQRVVTAIISLQSDQQLRNNMLTLRESVVVEKIISAMRLDNQQYYAALTDFMLQPAMLASNDIIRIFIEHLVTATGFTKAADTTKPAAKVQTPPTQDTRDTKSEVDLPDISKAELILNAVIGKKQSTGSSSESIAKPKEIRQDKEPADSSTLQELPEEYLYIQNGGLVILHPFLEGLFGHLDLLDDKKLFVSTSAAMRAAVLLSYLQNKTPLYEESEMAFNKIICGIPVQDLLPAGIELTQKEKRECDSLLATVIEHWQALGGASREALRETFIRRKARLSFKTDHWLLQVERNATDILLDRLPWGIGIIRLPWLTNLIYVEW